MYKTILLPIDLAHPEHADTMLATAAKLAAPDSRVILLNVIADVPAYVTMELPEGFLARSREHAAAELEKIRAGAGIDAEVAVRHGRPNLVILETAEAEGADLIVIASHDPGLEDYFLGSTAARVVRHAHCAVLVLR